MRMREISTPAVDRSAMLVSGWLWSTVSRLHLWRLMHDECFGRA